jgi:general nucleoside transport system permease protein
MVLDLVLKGIFSAAFLASILRISTPIILPALGGLVSELTGVMNIALEGIMLVAAFTGVVVSAYTQNLWVGVLAGLLSGVLISAFLAYFHIYLETDIFLAGIAINIMAAGGTIFLLYVLTGDKGNSSSLVSLSVPELHIPLLQDIPFLGTVISGHGIFTYAAILFTWLTAVFLYKTRLGAHARAVGENAVAAASVGINVKRSQFISLLISGFLAAQGGLALSMSYLVLFQRNMAAGRGFIALAAVFLGGKKPWGTFAAALIFGAADALGNQLGSLDIPPMFVQSIPYVVTILALVVYALRQKAQVLERRKRFLEQELAEAGGN